jgi:hypothetical protein
MEHLLTRELLSFITRVRGMMLGRMLWLIVQLPTYIRLPGERSIALSLDYRQGTRVMSPEDLSTTRWREYRPQTKTPLSGRFLCMIPDMQMSNDHPTRREFLQTTAIVAMGTQLPNVAKTVGTAQKIPVVGDPMFDAAMRITGQAEFIRQKLSRLSFRELVERWYEIPKTPTTPHDFAYMYACNSELHQRGILHVPLRSDLTGRDRLIAQHPAPDLTGVQEEIARHNAISTIAGAVQNIQNNLLSALDNSKNLKP